MWKKVEYSKREINDAGHKINDSHICEEERSRYLAIIDNWRAAHAYPMNTFAINLKRKTKDIDGAVVVQRIKRLDTIRGKLKRFPNMQLYRMQDLGGCRVIVPTIDDVYKVKKRLESSRIRHEAKTPKDYIKEPNPNTGYRGVHLIYKYKSDKTTDYNGLMIEIQIRTQLQHLWATAVETVGVFTDNGLKFNQGSEKWLHFFKLVSALFALEEGTTIVDSVSKDWHQIIFDLVTLESDLNAISKMETIGVTIQNIGHISKKKGIGYYLLIIDYTEHTLKIKEYEGIEKGLDKATEDYNEFEKKKNKHKEDAVLVAAQSYDTLVDAYPNYFANITKFIRELINIMSKYAEKYQNEQILLQAETEKLEYTDDTKKELVSV